MTTAITQDQLDRLNNYTAPPAPQANKPHSRSGLLANLPSVAAAAASFLPGVGIPAAAILGGGGEAISQLSNGENIDLARIGEEAALSAVPFGLGKAAKLAKVAKGVNVTKNVVADTKAAVAASKTAPKVANAAEAATTPFADKAKNFSADMRSDVRGIKPGVKAVGQDQLGVEDADALNNFLTNEAKITKGSAKSQLAQLEARHKTWGNDIGKVVSENNRALAPSDVTSIKGRISARIKDIPGLPRDDNAVALVGPDGKAILDTPGVTNHPYINDLYRDLGEVKDLAGANKLRQRLDADAINYGRNSNSPDPVKEQIAKAFRGGIDEYVSDQIPHLKPLQNLYSKSANAQDFLKNAAKNPAGVLGGPFISRAFNGLGGETLQATKMGAANVADDLAGSGVPGAAGSFIDKAKMAGKYGGAVIGQEATRGVAGALNPDEQAQAVATDTPPALTPEDILNTSESANPGIDYQAEADKILASGLSAKDQSAQLDILAKRQAIDAATAKASGTSGTKKLSAEANKQAANATNGLKALNDIQGMLASDSSLPVKDLAPGSIGKRISGAGTYEAAKQEIIDVLARLRTGAAISATEEKRFKAQLPAVGDDENTIAYKLNLYETLFNNILQNGSNGSPDLETAGVAQR